MQRMGFLEVLASEEGSQAAGDLLSSVSNLFKGLLDSFVIGDQVPEYPIKSKATLQKIIGEIKAAFPEPRNVGEAQIQLQALERSLQEAYAKGGAVNQTYAMIYEQVAQVLKNIIATGGVRPSPSPLPGTGYKPTSGGACPDGSMPDERGMCAAPAGKNNTLMYAGIAGLALILFMRRKK